MEVAEICRKPLRHCPTVGQQGNGIFAVQKENGIITLDIEISIYNLSQKGGPEK